MTPPEGCPRRVLHYWLPVADNPTTIKLMGDPLHVAASRLGVGPNAQHTVEFWAEGNFCGEGERERAFQVFGTGHPLPEGARYWGTAPRTPEGLVWHLYEVTPQKG